MYFLLILISSSSHHDQNHTSSGKKICLGVIDGSVVFENQSIGVPFEWDVVRMPMDKNQNTKAGILNWGISKSTKNPEAAWDLLKFLCGPEGNRIVAESNMALPGSTDKEALQIVLDSKFPSNVKAFVDSVPDCDLKDQLSIYRTEVNTKVQQLVDEMLIGKSTPEETQEKLIKEINAILAN